MWSHVWESIHVHVRCNIHEEIQIVPNRQGWKIVHHQHEEKEMTKLFHIKIQVKKTKNDALFDLGLHDNFITVELVKKFGLEVCDHPNSYPLGWVNKDAELKVTKECKIRFVIIVDFINEVDLDVVLLDVCGVMFGSPYMYM